MLDRDTVVRWVVIAGGLLLFYLYGWPLLHGSSERAGLDPVPAERYVDAPGFVPDSIDPPLAGHPTNDPPEGDLCTVHGGRFDAVLSSRGAGVKNLFLRDRQYGSEGHFDLSSTPTQERWRSLRTLFREGGAVDQVAYDRFLWNLTSSTGTSCQFTYEDETVRIQKSISALADEPFQLHVETALTNVAAAPKKHQFSIGTYAYRQNQELKGSLGRVSPFLTEVSCAAGTETTRKSKGDFKEGWLKVGGADRYAAVSSHFFAQALVPAPGAELPVCSLLVEDWFGEGQARDADTAGNVYHAKLVYPERELLPGATATYQQIAYFGPKERDVLAAVGGGKPRLGDVINLGFFTPVARVLVWILRSFHDHVTFGNWGAAVIGMTLCLRTLLFPLTWKSIQSTIAMRRLKPEVDALNAKFGDDAQAKNLAMMELWKKHGVNPLGGCLPQLVQMPVWFAMYTTLQTAVEMYHVRFLWFRDLSAPDPFYILPLLLGSLMIVQQRIVPQQGMDPVQQKMMMYMMPIVFTVMMLFLPAALGVYMLTNSALGITQQLAVEKIAPRAPAAGGGPQGGSVAGAGKSSRNNTPSAKGALPERLGKGKASV